MDSDERVHMHFHSSRDPELEWEVSDHEISEAFNEPYKAELSLRTRALEAEPRALLGSSATLVIDRGPLQRKLHGVVAHVVDGEHLDGHVRATVTLVPA
ncbi:MAG: hypothetical protein KC457_30965, partial [Myxococcales bacterium]|nr:hypothetical protein [Myxococcales bacterium]